MDYPTNIPDEVEGMEIECYIDEDQEIMCSKLNCFHNVDLTCTCKKIFLSGTFETALECNSFTEDFKSTDRKVPVGFEARRRINKIIKDIAYAYYKGE